MKQNCGFTLIELVLVIVILGILAASAIPSFVSVNSGARQSSIDGMAGALGSASAINHAIRSIKATDGVPITKCEDIANALSGGLSSDYTILSGIDLNNGTTDSCTVKHTEGGESASFVGHGIS